MATAAPARDGGRLPSERLRLQLRTAVSLISTRAQSVRWFTPAPSKVFGNPSRKFQLRDEIPMSAQGHPQSQTRKDRPAHSAADQDTLPPASVPSASVSRREVLRDAAIAAATIGAGARVLPWFLSGKRPEAALAAAGVGEPLLGGKGGPEEPYAGNWKTWILSSGGEIRLPRPLRAPRESSSSGSSSEPSSSGPRPRSAPHASGTRARLPSGGPRSAWT